MVAVLPPVLGLRRWMMANEPDARTALAALGFCTPGSQSLDPTYRASPPRANRHRLRDGREDSFVLGARGDPLRLIGRLDASEPDRQAFAKSARVSEPPDDLANKYPHDLMQAASPALRLP